MKGREIKIPFYGKVVAIKKKNNDDYSKMSDSPEKINPAPAPFEPDSQHSAPYPQHAYLSNSQPAVPVKTPSKRERLVQSLSSVPGFLKKNNNPKKPTELDDLAEERHAVGTRSFR
jgi:hypothetical protein